MDSLYRLHSRTVNMSWWHWQYFGFLLYSCGAKQFSLIRMDVVYNLL